MATVASLFNYSDIDRMKKTIPRVLTPIYVILFIVLTSCATEVGEPQQAGKLMIMTGSYNDPGSDGVSLLAYHHDSNIIELIDNCDAGPNPSFIHQAAGTNRFYAVNEVSPRGGGGGVTSIMLDTSTQKLVAGGRLAISGSGPCHVTASTDGRLLFISNYGDGSLSVVSVDTTGVPSFEPAYFRYHRAGDGVPHAHMAMLFDDERKLLVSDLGLDRLVEYNLVNSGFSGMFPDHAGDIMLPAGTGPRHLCFDHAEKFLYVVNELSSEVTVIKRHTNGNYSHINSVSTLPDDFTGENYCSGIVLSPDGKYLYVGNRGHNSIAVFSVESSGIAYFRGTVDCEGDWPRTLDISANGKMLVVANQRSDNIALFNISSEDGMPSYTGAGYSMKSPASAIFVNSIIK